MLEPSFPALQASAIPSQLPVHLHVKRWKKARKNPVSLVVTPGSPTFASLERPSVTSDMVAHSNGHRGADSRLATRYYPHIH